MSEAWEAARQALATKLGSAAMLAAGIKKADTLTGDPLETPAIRVLDIQGYDLIGRPTARMEQWRLEIAAELMVDLPDGRKRSAANVADLARAVQVEFRSGITLGATVVECVLLSYRHGLVEYAYTGKDGGRFTFQVDVNEILSTPRSA